MDAFSSAPLKRWVRLRSHSVGSKNTLLRWFGAKVKGPFAAKVCTGWFYSHNCY
jgi:hypothetical protein